MANLSIQAMEFDWMLKNFTMCAQLPGEPICSPKFCIDPFGSKLSLHLYVRNEGDDNCVSFKLFLHKSDYPQLYEEKEHLLRVEIPMCELTKNKRFLFENSILFNRELCCEYSNWFKGKVLLKTRTDSLNVRIQIWPQKNLKCMANKVNNEDLINLSSDIAKGLQNNKHSDLILRSANGTLFKAHKAILLSRYPNFSEFVGLQESRELRLDMDCHTLQFIMKYLYSGQVDLADVPSEIFKMLDSAALTHLQNTLFPVPNYIKATTTIRIRSGSFVWEIPSFSALGGNVIINHVFSCEELLRWTKLRFQFFFSQNDKNEQCVSFSLHRIFSEESVSLTCQIKIIGSKRHSRKYYFFCENDKDMEIPNFIQSKVLIAKKNSLLIKDILRIKIEINISNGMHMSDIATVSFPDVTKENCYPISMNLWALQQDLLKLYKNPIFSDVTLCVGHERFPAHKMILSVRSPVFCKMFEYDTLEERTGQIIIEDFESYVVQAMLLYMYCGETDKAITEFDSITDIYAAASKYELINMMRMYAEFFRSMLRVNNIGQIWLIADTYFDADLKKFVSNFICHHASEVLHSCEWEDVLDERVDLKTEILQMAKEYENYDWGRILPDNWMGMG